MRVFQDALPERARWLREELRWVAHALGDVRDLDVQIERFQAWKEEADEESAEFLDWILKITEKRRVEARKNMLDVLESGRYERLESSFAEMLRRGPGAEEELAHNNGHDPAREKITAAAPPLVSRRYRKWRKAAKRLDENSSPEAFHDVRKKGKRLRYTLEFVSEVYGKPVQRLVKPLKTLQDDLGDHQDDVVTAGYLRQLGTRPMVREYRAGPPSRWASTRNAAPARRRTFAPACLVPKPFRALTKGKRWKRFEKIMQEARKNRNVAEPSSKSVR